MDSSEGHAAQPLPDPAPARRPDWRRRLAIVFLVAFGVGGWLLFGPKVPRQVEFSLELSPTLRSDQVVFPRAEVIQVDAALFDREGVRVAVISLPSPSGLEGPRTATAVVSVKPGTYDVRAKARGKRGGVVELRGVMTPGDGPAVVDMR